MFKVQVQIMSRKLGDDSQTILVDSKNIYQTLKELEKKVIPLVSSNWIVAARKTGTKEPRQVLMKDLVNIESKFYDQLASGKVDKLVVTPPIIGG